MILIEYNNEKVKINSDFSIESKSKEVELLFKQKIKWFDFDSTGASGNFESQLFRYFIKEGIKIIDYKYENDGKKSVFEKIKNIFKK